MVCPALHLNTCVTPTHVCTCSHGTFCCDQSPCANGHSSFLFEGRAPLDVCATKCLEAYNPDVCRYITTASVGSGDFYCMNAQFCNTTDTFHGSNVTTWERTTPPRPYVPPPPPPPPPKPPAAAFSIIDPASKSTLPCTRVLVRAPEVQVLNSPALCWCA